MIKRICLAKVLTVVTQVGVLCAALIFFAAPYHALAQLDSSNVSIVPSILPAAERNKMVQDLKEDLKADLRLIQALGAQSIQGKPLANLIEAIDRTQVEIVESLRYYKFTKYGAVYRSSAYWDRIANKILISQRHVNSLTKPGGPRHIGLGGLMIHEFFGLNGLKDDSFGISAMIHLAKLICDAKIPCDQDQFKFIPRLIQEVESPRLSTIILASRGGGTSGVGGGGDFRLLWAKTDLLLNLFVDGYRPGVPETAFSYALQFLMMIDIEFHQNLKHGSLAFDQETNLLLIPDEAFTSGVYNKKLNEDQLQQVALIVLEKAKVIEGIK